MSSSEETDILCRFIHTQVICDSEIILVSCEMVRSDSLTVIYVCFKDFTSRLSLKYAESGNLDSIKDENFSLEVVNISNIKQHQLDRFSLNHLEY